MADIFPNETFDFVQPSTSTSTESLPASWKIAPIDVLNGDAEAMAKCPKESATFIAFIISNAIVSVLGLLTGYRPFIHKVSCGHLGKPGRRNTIVYSWLFPLALHISANALVAVIIHNTPGYGHVKIQNAMMIYFVRPRISPLILVTATCFVKPHEEYPWMYALIANTIAELLLQIIADAWVIATGVGSWNTAAMGIGIVMCISTGLFFLATIFIVLATRPYDATGGDVFHKDRAAGFRISNSFGTRFKNWFWIMLMGGPAYLISWGFFINLITTLKTDWCPPKLAAQVAIWVLLPLLGTIGGVGVF